MRQEMIPQIDNLIQKLTELRAEFENGLNTGRSLMELKMIHLQMRELLGQLQKLEPSRENGASAN